YRSQREQLPLTGTLHHGGLHPRADERREGVPYGWGAFYTGKVLPRTLRALALHLRDAREREPLEYSVLPDEGGDEVGGGSSQDVLRGIILGQDAALLHYGDPVTHLYRLVYVVGDEDYGLPDLLLDLQKLVLQP